MATFVWMVGLAACRPAWTSPDLPPLAHELTASEAAAAIALSKNLVSGRFPSEVAKDCATNGPRFVWLAAHQRTAAVVRAALFAATDCARSGTADLPDLALAAAAHVDGADRRTLDAALNSARATIAAVPADHPLVVRLVHRAQDADPVLLYELLDVLDLRAWGGEAAVEGVFLVALRQGEAPWLVSDALRRVRGPAADLTAAAEVRALALVHVNALDPGVRGRAALVLAALGPVEVAERDLILALLDDSHGFVRSAAAEALGVLGYLPAVHALMARLDDFERNTWDMEPFTRLDGTAVVSHHAGSKFERVDDAYLWAIQALTGPMGEERFVYRDVNLRWRDLDVIAASRDARKWYEVHREQIPALE